MKKLLLSVLLCFPIVTVFSQAITTNTTTYTVPQLVQDVLFGVPGSSGGSCAGSITNVTWSTGTNFGSTNGIGYFTNTNPAFPLSSGVILSTGNVLNAPGPNSGTLSDGSNAWPGDIQLFNYISGLGIDAGLTDYNNATVLEFDFTPLTNMMSFDFLFASDEYGTFQCAYSDAFAFFLTNVTAGTAATNLALIPSTTTPVSVVTIRDDAYNSSCGSANPTFFGNYNTPGGTGSATDFNGETVVMTATSSVVPNNVYHIKLVIADRNDTAYDSAVFLGGGSFNIGQATITGTGPFVGQETDFTIGAGTALCGSQCMVVNAGSAPIPGASYQWSDQNGPIAGATNFSYNICQAGTYTITITFGSGCSQTDSMLVEYMPAPSFAEPLNVCESGGTYNLTQNNPVMLNGLSSSDFNITYHHSFFDAQNLNNPITNPTAYNGTTGETIYAAIEDTNMGCIYVKQFDLIACGGPVTPPDLALCDDASNDGFAIFDMSGQTAIALGTNNAADYTITYHASQSDADNDVNPLSPINAFPNTVPFTQPIFIRMESNSNPTNFGTTSFDLIVNNQPAVPTVSNVTACDTYTLPALGAGQSYHSASGGTSPLGSTTITGAGPHTVWVFAQSGTTPNCTSEASFTVTINATPAVPTVSNVTACDSYTLAALPAGQSYHTASGGASPLGSTTITGAGPHTVWVFAQSGTTPNCTSEASFTVTINNTPATPVVSNVTACDSYTLAALPAGQSYHTASGGAAGTLITNPTITGAGVHTIWTFAQSGTTPNCTSEASFTVTINATPAVPTVSNVTACDSYTLAALPAGQSYHTASGGTSPLGSTTITGAGPHTVWVFAQSGTTPNCTSEASFTVTINNTPATPVVSNVTACDSYTLAALPAGQSYHTASGGAAGTLITNPTITGAGVHTIWTFAQTGTTPNCTSEASFTVTINATPAVPTVSNVTACDSYTLAALPAGQSYHTASGGASPLGSTTITGAGPHTIWVFAQSGTTPNCTSEASFTVTINNTPATPVVSNVTACDSYTLAALPAGQSYHTASGGAAGTLITNPTITGAGVHTIWTFAQTGTTPNCSSEASFTVTINATPAVPTVSNVTACDSYTLAALPAGQSYHTASGGASPLGSTTITGAGPHTIWVFAQSGTTPNCTSEASFTVTINNTPATPVVSNVTACDSYTLAALPAGQSYHTASGGAAGTLITNPTITGAGVHTIWVFAQSGTTPNCTSEASFTVTINATPVADDPADVVACNSYTLPALNVGEYHTAGSGGGIVLPAGHVVTATTTLYVFAQSGTTPNCTDENSFDIGIFNSPVINNPTPLELCDDNNDGFSCFVLSSKDAEITGGAANLVVTYHETAIDAQNGVTPLNSANYCNIVPGVQILHVRVTDVLAPLCASLTTLELHVNPVPVPKPNIDDYQLCDVNSPGDGIEGFDLHTKDTEILNGQSAAVSYYASLADAQSATGPITANPYFNTTPDLQQVWVRLEYATGCFAVSSFSLKVNPLPAVSGPLSMSQCSEGTPNTASFNLVSNDLTASGGQVGRIVSYHLTLADAQNEVGALASPYTNISNPQVLYIRVEDTATGCFDTTTLTLSVTQGPSAFTPTPLQECDPNNDGFAAFDLESTRDQVAGGSVPAGVSVTYHETLTDAQNGVTALSSPYTNIVAFDQTVYVRVFYVATGCYNIVELQLHVNLTPQATQIDDLEVCDDNADGTAAFDLTLATPGILGSLDPALHTVTYYVDQPAAQAGTNPITNVLAYNSATGSIWVRVEDNATGCFDVIELGLLVNPLPLLPNTPGGAIAPYSLCDVNNPGDEREQFDLSTKIPEIVGTQTGMSVEFYRTLAEAQSGVGALPNLYTNQFNAQTLHVVIRNIDTGCFVLTTMDLRVEPLPAPIPPSGPVTVCDPDRDGFAPFDLDALIPAMVQGAPDIAITFHETLADAQDGLNPLPATYVNITPLVQFIYVRAENTVTRCQSTMMIELNVIASPQAPVLDPLVSCDDDASNQNGFHVFNLRAQDAPIMAVQTGNPANYAITYYLDQPAAQAGTSPIVNATAYTNTTPFLQVIWYRISDVANQCFNIGSFELRVNLPVALTHPTPLAICDDGPTSANPQAQFDLTVKNNEITGGVLADVSYYLTQAAAQTGTGAIANPTAYTNTVNPQTLFVAVSTTDGCRSYTTLTIRVLSLPVPLAAEDLETCDDDADGIAIFDLTAGETQIANNDPDMAFEYYPAQGDAEAQTNMISNPTAYPSASGQVWIRVIRDIEPNYLGEFCSVIIPMDLQVNPLAVTQDVRDTWCDATASGVTTHQFTLSGNNSSVIANDPGQPGDYTFTYYLTMADAQAGTSPLPNAYTNVTNPQDVYVVVENNDTQCSKIAVVTLEVLTGAAANPVTASPLVHCDDDGTNDGIFNVFDLTQLNPTILGSQDPAVYSVAYYTDPAATAAVSDPTQYAGATGFVYAQVTNTATGCKSTVVAISVTVEKLPEPVITSDHGNTICVDYTSGLLLPGGGLTMDSGLPSSGYTFEWTHDGAIVGTSNTYTVTDPATGPGLYTVTATSTTLGCVSVPSAQASFTVIKSGPAELNGQGYTVTNAFADNQVITIDVVGFGQYQYSLDGGPWQDLPVFENVGPGAHQVVIRDNNQVSCGDIQIPVINVIDYPHYFTPNGDGIHDTWNIIGMEGDTSAKIYIFDRYGKLLKQLSPVSQSQGWDGTFNGQQLPSTDYWFTVQYSEANATKEFKAHFSLKR